MIQKWINFACRNQRHGQKAVENCCQIKPCTKRQNGAKWMAWNFPGHRVNLYFYSLLFPWPPPPSQNSMLSESDINRSMLGAKSSSDSALDTLADMLWFCFPSKILLAHPASKILGVESPFNFKGLLKSHLRHWPWLLTLPFSAAESYHRRASKHFAEGAKRKVTMKSLQVTKKTISMNPFPLKALCCL